MKKLIIAATLACFALGSQAQVLKNNLLNGYKEGGKLENTISL